MPPEGSALSPDTPIDISHESLMRVWDRLRRWVDEEAQSSQVYRESLATINRKLSEAYAAGLADGHPEVRQLKDEKQRIETLINDEMRSETTQEDRQANPGLQNLGNRVETLQAQLNAARSDLSDTERSLSQVRKVVGDLPRVEERGEQGPEHLLFESRHRSDQYGSSSGFLNPGRRSPPCSPVL